MWQFSYRCTFAHVIVGASSTRPNSINNPQPSLMHPPTPTLSQLHRPVSQSMAGLSGPAEAPAHGGGINKLLAPFCQL